MAVRAYYRIDHKAVRNVPDDGMCAEPNCERWLEADTGIGLRHMRGGGTGRIKGSIKVASVDMKINRRVERVTAANDETLRRVKTLEDTVEKLKKKAQEQSQQLGVVRNELKQLLKRVQTLENSPKEPRISHRRIVDGGIHAKDQRNRPNNSSNEPKLLKAG